MQSREAKGEFLVAAGIAHNVKTITDNFFNYIAQNHKQLQDLK
jgi:hypothetical protein